MDIQFTQPTDPTDDQDLAAAIERRTGKSSWPPPKSPQTAKPKCSVEIRYSMNWEPRAAYSVLTLDSDGEVRRLSYAKNGLKSFPVVTAGTGRPAAGPGFPVPPRTAADRLRRPARNPPPGIVLQRPGWQAGSKSVCQQDRHRRRLSADPSRRSRHGHHQRHDHVGAGSVGQRGLHALCGERRCETFPDGSTCS